MESTAPHGAKRKIWGWDFDLGIDRDRAEEHGHKIISRRALAWIRCGGFSSIHLHEHQSNAFYCLGGRLVILEFERDGGVPVLLGESILYPGDDLSISAGRMHQFFALEHTRLLEIYVAKPGCDALAEDIQRFSVNGCDESLVMKYVYCVDRHTGAVGIHAAAAQAAAGGNWQAAD